MDATKLATIISLLIALSVASERLVEVIKSLVPWLDAKKTDDTSEGRRRAGLQVLAVVASIMTAYLARPVIPQDLLPVTDPGLTVLALGLLASGGSGFWNSILSYVLEVKNINKSLAKAAQTGAASNREVQELRAQLANLGGK